MVKLGIRAGMSRIIFKMGLDTEGVQELMPPPGGRIPISDKSPITWVRGEGGRQVATVRVGVIQKTHVPLGDRVGSEIVSWLPEPAQDIENACRIIQRRLDSLSEKHPDKYFQHWGVYSQLGCKLRPLTKPRARR